MFIADGENEFFFGLATAPAHVEDRLNDAWLEFAEENPREETEIQEGHPKLVDALTGPASGDGGSQHASSSRDKANKTVKKKKPLKIAMEAMIRGFEKYVEGGGEEEEGSVPNQEGHHNVAAWHNVPHP